MKTILRQLPAMVAATMSASALLIGFAGTAHAQTPVNPILPEKGTKEIFLNGNFIFDPDSSQQLTVGYAPFLTRNWQVGGSVGYFNPSEGDSQYDVSGFVNYHFPSQSALLPFVGVTLGYTDPGSSTDSFVYGVQGGVKYFLNQNVSANATLVYRDYARSGYDDDFRLSLGLSVYLR